MRDHIKKAPVHFRLNAYKWEIGHENSLTLIAKNLTKPTESASLIG